MKLISCLLYGFLLGFFWPLIGQWAFRKNIYPSISQSECMLSWLQMQVMLWVTIYEGVELHQRGQNCFWLYSGLRKRTNLESNYSIKYVLSLAWILPFLCPQYLHLLKFAHLHLGQLKQTIIYQGKFNVLEKLSATKTITINTGR